MALLVGSLAHAANLPITVSYPADVAFARYVALQTERDPFATAQPAVVLIEASLPGLYKSAALIGIRRQGEDELQVLQTAGDGTVLSEVVERYLSLRQQGDQLPSLSKAITPANYKFQFGGEMKTGAGAAYIYDLAPKKKRSGLMYGQLWMDSATGHEVMLSGYLSDLPGWRGRVDVVRETQRINGLVAARVTHLRFSVPRLGRAEVIVTEAVPNLAVVSTVE